MATPRKDLVRRALAAAAVVLGTLTATTPSPVSAQTACPVSATEQQVDTEEQEVLTLLNQYRAQRGLNPVSLSPAATRAAAWFSRDMASNDRTPANHMDSNGRTIAQRLTWCGVNYNGYAENIYWGSPDGQAAFNWWRNSPTHDANMRLPWVTHVGIARAFDASSQFDWYWTLDLTSGEPTTTPPLPVAGATFYADGTIARTGPSGALVSAFATRAEPGFGYRLVSGRAGNGQPCALDVVPVNATVKYPTNAGFIPSIGGTLNRPPGAWQLCFLAEGQTVTAAVTYTVTV